MAGPIYPGRPNESLPAYLARIHDMCAAIEAANPGRCWINDAPPPDNPDVQRQWPALGSTS